MGFCMSCFRGSADTSNQTPGDVTLKRKQMAEAAERRQQEQEARGLQDLERVKRHQERWRDVDQALEQGSNTQGLLRWQVG